MHGELAAMDDEQFLPRLRKAVEQDGSGLVVAVALLDSDRPAAARAARVVLVERLGRWRIQSRRDASIEIAALSAELAARAASFRPAAGDVAADLAAQILVWPLDDKAVDVPAVTAHCVTVLRAAGRRIPSASATDGAVDGIQSTRGTAAARRSPLDELPAEIAVMPSLAIRRVATSPSVVAPQRALPAESASEFRLTATRNPSLIGDVVLADSPPPDAITLLQRNAELIAGFGGMEHIDVMRHLHDRQPQVSQAAEVELDRRGFSERQIHVARRLTDPDWKTRLALANELEPHAAADSRSWLVWLARDANVQVRIAALKVLAADRDPRQRRQLRELLAQESEPDVVKQIQSLLRSQ